MVERKHMADLDTVFRPDVESDYRVATAFDQSRGQTDNLAFDRFIRCVRRVIDDALFRYLDQFVSDHDFLPGTYDGERGYFGDLVDDGVAQIFGLVAQDLFLARRGKRPSGTIDLPACAVALADSD